MSDLIYYIICGILTLAVLSGIAMMSKVKTSVLGNGISALATGLAMLVTLYKYNILSDIWLWVFVAVGLLLGLVGAYRVKMIDMPQTVAVLNGFGGAASALVAAVSLISGNVLTGFSLWAAALALIIGSITLTGSLVAGGKLAKLISQRPVVWKNHQLITVVSLLASLAAVAVLSMDLIHVVPGTLICLVISGFFGVAFALRVGGADMPITISLLNSLSGVAGSIAGMAINDPLLVAVGGVVGSSGLLLTQIMCRAMNRKLSDILFSKAAAPKSAAPAPAAPTAAPVSTSAPAAPIAAPAPAAASAISPAEVLASAKKVIIVPGYGMALAQAQGLVKQIADNLESNGIEVKFAIHPVAGRMPGHMNVLLCEVDVPYEKLHEMDEINAEFAGTDAVLVVGANDVMNSAANTAKDTPIYGMPVLNVGDAKHVIICNYDLKPGYAGVDNPLYHKESGVTLLLGDAIETLGKLAKDVNSAFSKGDAPVVVTKDDPAQLLLNSKKVIIVPGYGMALAQAQRLVKQIADRLESDGTEVKFAIHPVAGRMPGHMNVLLCEVDVPYEKLHEMDEINPEFATADVALVVGANDVMNSAANTAKDTPIYGMPVLNVGDAKHVIICNYDLKPGYAGVDNPLYHKESGVTLLLGDAIETLGSIIKAMN